MIALAETDVFDLCSCLEIALGSFDFQVFDQGYGVAVGEGVAVGVFDRFIGLACRSVFRVLGGPLVPAVRAGEEGAVFIGVLGVAFWAIWYFAHRAVGLMVSFSGSVGFWGEFCGEARRLRVDLGSGFPADFAL